MPAPSSSRLKRTESQTAIRWDPLIRFARKLPLKAPKTANPHPSPLSISQADQWFGTSSRTTPSVLKHLHVLETGGGVVSEKVGRVRTYRLAPDALAPVEAWVADQQAAAGTTAATGSGD